MVIHFSLCSLATKKSFYVNIVPSSMCISILHIKGCYPVLALYNVGRKAFPLVLVPEKCCPVKALMLISFGNLLITLTNNC